MKITMPVEIYTDGSCLRNPGGVGGLAYIIRYYEDCGVDQMPKEHTIEFNQGYRSTTNNRMEVMAFILACKCLINKVETKEFENVRQINAWSDSEYFVNPINKKWINKWEENNWMTSGFKGSKPTDIKNKDLWVQIIDLQKQLKAMGIILNISHVKGHNGDEFNEKCDKLAVAASNGTTFVIDEMYEKTTNIANVRNW